MKSPEEMVKIEPSESWGKHWLGVWTGSQYEHVATDYSETIRLMAKRIIAAIRDAQIEAMEEALKIASGLGVQGVYVMGNDGGSYWQSDTELTKQVMLSAIHARIEELRK